MAPLTHSLCFVPHAVYLPLCTPCPNSLPSPFPSSLTSGRTSSPFSSHMTVPITLFSSRTWNAPFEPAVTCAAVPGPGSYGGPPVDKRIRVTWGGKNEDPLESSDYIWNKDWKKAIADDVAVADKEKGSGVESKDMGSGFLSIGRSLALDSMEVDLSAELSKPSRASLARQVAAARQLGRVGDEVASSTSSSSAAASQKAKEKEGGIKWRFAPTDKEQKKWDASSKYLSAKAGDGRKQMTPEQRIVDAEKERVKFQELKTNLVVTTVAMGGLFTGCAYAIYTPEVAASYAFGAVGAVVYLRMLSQSVEGLGSGTAQGAVRGAIGQPRLLVPVVLVMAFNRWNAVIAPEYNFIPLQLIPILVGFFTYKAATLVQAMKDILLPLLPEDEN